MLYIDAVHEIFVGCAVVIV